VQNKIFEETYKEYMMKINDISLKAVSKTIGASFEDDCLEISLLNDVYKVYNSEITDQSGNKPSYDICIILIKYILMCPDMPPEDEQWIAFRDFKDSAPLIKYFSSEVEGAISSFFSEKSDQLKEAGTALGGFKPKLDVNYDIALQFNLLPRIPVILLFNDKDDEFFSTASVLFEKRAEKYLDAECLAIIGVRFFDSLKKAMMESQ